MFGGFGIRDLVGDFIICCNSPAHTSSPYDCRDILQRSYYVAPAVDQIVDQIGSEVPSGNQT